MLPPSPRRLRGRAPLLAALAARGMALACAGAARQGRVPLVRAGGRAPLAAAGFCVAAHALAALRPSPCARNKERHQGRTEKEPREKKKRARCLLLATEPREQRSHGKNREAPPSASRRCRRGPRGRRATSAGSCGTGRRRGGTGPGGPRGRRGSSGRRGPRATSGRRRGSGRRRLDDEQAPAARKWQTASTGKGG